MLRDLAGKSSVVLDLVIRAPSDTWRVTTGTNLGEQLRDTVVWNRLSHQNRSNLAKVMNGIDLSKRSYPRRESSFLVFLLHRSHWLEPWERSVTARKTWYIFGTSSDSQKTIHRRWIIRSLKSDSDVVLDVPHQTISSMWRRWKHFFGLYRIINKPIKLSKPQQNGQTDTNELSSCFMMASEGGLRYDPGLAQRLTRMAIVIRSDLFFHHLGPMACSCEPQWIFTL